MATLSNLTNGPFDVMTRNGIARIGAYESLTDDFAPEYLDLLEVCGAVSVTRDDSASPQQKRRGRPRKEVTE